MGWSRDRIVGGHAIYTHAELAGTLALPTHSGGGDVNPGLTKWLLAQARRGAKGRR